MNPNHDDHGRFASGDRNGISSEELARRNVERANREAVAAGLAHPDILKQPAVTTLGSHLPAHQDLHRETVARPLQKAYRAQQAENRYAQSVRDTIAMNRYRQRGR